MAKVFIQVTQVQFLGRELRSPLKPPLTAASPRSLPHGLLPVSKFLSSYKDTSHNGIKAIQNGLLLT